MIPTAYHPRRAVALLMAQLRAQRCATFLILPAIDLATAITGGAA